MARPSFIKTGAGIALVSVLTGFVPTVIGMYATFYDLASQSSVDAESLSGSIGMALIWATVSIPFATLGVAIFIAGLFMAPKNVTAEPGSAPDVSTHARGL